jgi:hypothetical protein
VKLAKISLCHIQQPPYNGHTFRPGPHVPLRTGNRDPSYNERREPQLEARAQPQLRERKAGTVRCLWKNRDGGGSARQVCAGGSIICWSMRRMA